MLLSQKPSFEIAGQLDGLGAVTGLIAWRDFEPEMRPYLSDDRRSKTLSQMPIQR